MRRVCGLVCGLLLLALPVAAWITDTAIHPPPYCGVYAYESFTPASPAFPAVGGTYLDPIFGEVFTRLTNVYPSTTAGSPIIYGVNGRWNADNTAFIHSLSGTIVVLNPTTGATIRSGVPYPSGTTGEQSFDPVSANIYYYTSGTTLQQYDISTGSSSTVKNFGSTLGGLGQSADWIDTTGTYFLLNIAGSARVWKKSTDTLYTGSITIPSDVTTGGWAGISPDGNYVIFSHANFGTNHPKGSFAVNHGTTTLSTTEVIFWDAGGSDHGDVLTASDGNTYMIVPQALYSMSGSTRHLFRALVTNNVAGLGSAQLTATGNQMLLPVLSSNTVGNGDFACGAKGAYQDWCYANIADPADTLGNPGTWYAYRQETFMIHMVAPFEVRRLMHHRARPHRGYCRQVRMSATWDGSKIMFTSPFSAPDPNADCGYSDLYRWDAP